MTEAERPVSELSVAEMIALIKEGGGGGPNYAPGPGMGQCPLMRRIGTLPADYQEALRVTMPDMAVCNLDIVAFLQAVGINVHPSEVQRHRNRKRGCQQCGTPPPMFVGASTGVEL